MSKRFLVITVSLTVWLATTSVAALLAAGYGLLDAREHFVEESGITAQAINARIYDITVTTEMTALYLRGVAPERDDFRLLGRSLLSGSPYLDELIYLPRVRSKERTLFERHRHDEGFVTYRIRDWAGGAVLPARTGGSHYPVMRVEPFTPGSARLLGRDALSLPCLAPILQKALLHGRTALLDDCPPPATGEGVWLLRPLYAGREPPGDIEEFRSRAQGVIALRFSPARLFADVRLPPRIRYRLSGPQEALIFANGIQTPGPTVTTLTHRISLPFGGDDVSLDLERPVPVGELLEMGGGFSALLGLSSALLAGLLTANLWERRRAQEALQRHRDHLEEEVATRTRELSRTNEALQEEIAERRRAESELAQLAVRDPLTGLYNRREMERRLEEEIERCRRYHHPLAVLMLDIDHFKRLNDTYGHQVGDDVLRTVAMRLDRAVRRADFVARYGGEEFLAILPDTPLEHAVELAERIRADIAGSAGAVVDGKGVQVTASLGVAVFPPHGGDRASLCRSADRALYQAKSGGRNRVEAFTGVQGAH